MQNSPLYLEAFEASSDEEILRFHNIAHCALDAVEKALEDEKGEEVYPSLLTYSSPVYD